MFNKFKIIYGLMDQADKRRLIFIMLTSIANGIFSVIGIASILPFIGIISEPELINSNQYILSFKEFSGIYSYQGIVLAFGGLSFILVLVGNLASALDVWVANRFGYQKELQLSQRLLRIYLEQDDLEFKRQKNSQRAKNILADVDRVILDTVFSMLEMLSGLIVAVFIFGLLLFVDLHATLIITAAIVSVYLSVYFFTASRLDSLGKEFANLETDIYSEVLEALKLQREIKLASLQSFFVGRYAKSFSQMVNNRLKYEFISLIPQHLIEVVAYGTILLLAIYFSLVEQSNLSAITMIGVYAFATYRLMPAISEVFDSYERIQFGSAILKNLVAEYKSSFNSTHESNNVLKVHNEIRLKNIQFRYSATSSSLFSDLNLEFPADQFVCIKGKTGCGKSTLLNLVAGIYRVQSGEILIDGKVSELYQNSAWQSNLGYVPTQVQLVDGRIIENIALGVPKNKIDKSKINNLCRLLELDELLDSLEHGIDTKIGDGEISVSSGQIQKLGIARALYRNPQVLLLDEATDALDLDSEKRIIKNIISHFNLTMLFVSHRPSIQILADSVIDLEEQLVAK